jgi:hypothetical protein
MRTDDCDAKRYDGYCSIPEYLSIFTNMVYVYAREPNSTVFSEHELSWAASHLVSDVQMRCYLSCPYFNHHHALLWFVTGRGNGSKHHGCFNILDKGIGAERSPRRYSAKCLHH